MGFGINTVNRDIGSDRPVHLNAPFLFNGIIEISGDILASTIVNRVPAADCPAAFAQSENGRTLVGPFVIGNIAVADGSTGKGQATKGGIEPGIKSGAAAPSDPPLESCTPTVTATPSNTLAV